jgi:hypothetical protein
MNAVVVNQPFFCFSYNQKAIISPIAVFVVIYSFTIQYIVNYISCIDFLLIPRHSVRIGLD